MDRNSFTLLVQYILSKCYHDKESLTRANNEPTQIFRLRLNVNQRTELAPPKIQPSNPATISNAVVAKKSARKFVPKIICGKRPFGALKVHEK